MCALSFIRISFMNVDTLAFRVFNIMMYLVILYVEIAYFTLMNLLIHLVIDKATLALRYILCEFRLSGFG